jgi:cytochrome P450
MASSILPSFSSLVLVAGSLLLVLLTKHLISTLIQYHRLAHIKGPWSTGWSGLFVLWSVVKNTVYLDLGKACKKYGPLTRVGPNTLLTNDPELIRRMNAVRSPYRKSGWYEQTDVSHERHHIISETDEERHAELRTRMAGGYSGKDLGNTYLEQCIDDRLQDLAQLVKNKYTSTREAVRPVDLARLLQFFAIDVITDIAFREPFGFLKADHDIHGYITTQEQLIPIFEWLSALPFLSKIVRVPWISKLVMPKPTDATGMGYMLGIAKRTVEQRFGPEKVVKDDMLGSFIKHGLDQKQAELEAAVQVILGTDTVVSSLRSISLYVITNPHVYAKLQAELDSASLSSPIATDSEVRELPYLQACIKEGMRVFPPVTGLFSKRVPAGGDTVCGKFVPEGTDIAYCAWDFYKDPAVFGEDAEYFRPDRWLEADEEQMKKMQKTMDLAFGYGKYSCLGKPIALLELGKATAEVSGSL